MLCQNCKKNLATYHRCVSINGVSSYEHLCSNCVNDMNISSVMLNDSIFNIIRDFYDFKEIFSRQKKSLETNNDNYYANYQKLLNKAENNINIGAKKYKDNYGANNEIMTLKSRMKMAIEQENYEYAGILKRQIDEIKKNMC